MHCTQYMSMFLQSGAWRTLTCWKKLTGNDQWRMGLVSWLGHASDSKHYLIEGKYHQIVSRTVDNTRENTAVTWGQISCNFAFSWPTHRQSTRLANRPAGPAAFHVVLGGECAARAVRNDICYNCFRPNTLPSSGNFRKDERFEGNPG